MKYRIPLLISLSLMLWPVSGSTLELPGVKQTVDGVFDTFEAKQRRLIQQKAKENIFAAVIIHGILTEIIIPIMNKARRDITQTFITREQKIGQYVEILLARQRQELEQRYQTQLQKQTDQYQQELSTWKNNAQRYQKAKERSEVRYQNTIERLQKKVEFHEQKAQAEVTDYRLSGEDIYQYIVHPRERVE